MEGRCGAGRTAPRMGGGNLRARNIGRILILLLGLAPLAAAQQASPEPARPPEGQQEFLRTADELLLEVSRHVGLPLRTPLKKSLRSREEIRRFVELQLQEEKAEELRAEQLTLEKFGLAPKDFQLVPFLLDLLEEQVAGLYDPKSQEFYIAAWLDPAEQRVVMTHELVHALQDQHFHLKQWIDAAKPNDDAEMARDAVAEGSATLAMFEFMARDLGLPNTSARSMGDLSLLLRAGVAGGLPDSPRLAEAPPFLRDALMFPYVEGAIFSQQVLKRLSGWEEFRSVFEKPPVSTQQILHPELYLQGVEPVRVELAAADGALPKRWKKLEENLMGEFGVRALLKQLAGEEIAAEIAPGWVGDRYSLYEDAQNQETLLLLFRVQFSNETTAARFFGAYSDVLEGKYASARNFFRRPNFFAFESDEGGVFLHCVAGDCLISEGDDREAFDAVNRALGRPAAPPQPTARKRKVAETTWPTVPPPRGEVASHPAPTF